MMENLKSQNSKLKSVPQILKVLKFLVVVLTFNICVLSLPTPVHAQTATLSLNPSTGTFNRDCPVSLKIDLNTNGVQTDGTDAILKYDSSRLTATSISSGTIYQDYPGNSIDDSSGKIIVSGLASPTTAFSGQGTLATVNFIVKDTATTGATQVAFDFTLGSTTDSNVVQRGTVAEVLGSVVNGNYTIGSGTTCSAPATLPATGGTNDNSATPSGGIEEEKKPVYKTLPPAGSENLTFTLAIVGSVLTVLGILGLALL